VPIPEHFSVLFNPRRLGWVSKPMERRLKVASASTPDGLGSRSRWIALLSLQIIEKQMYRPIFKPQISIIKVKRKMVCFSSERMPGAMFCSSCGAHNVLVCPKQSGPIPEEPACMHFKKKKPKTRGLLLPMFARAIAQIRLFVCCAQMYKV
jgi:hypothetical protein